MWTSKQTGENTFNCATRGAKNFIWNYSFSADSEFESYRFQANQWWSRQNTWPLVQKHMELVLKRPEPDDELEPDRCDVSALEIQLSDEFPAVLCTRYQEQVPFISLEKLETLASDLIRNQNNSMRCEWTFITTAKCHCERANCLPQRARPPRQSS